jgi:hypothetical protein
VCLPFRLESYVCLPSPVELYGRLVGPLFRSESVRLVCSPSPLESCVRLERQLVGFEIYLRAVLPRIGFETDHVVPQRVGLETDRVVPQRIGLETYRGTIMISDLSSAGCIGSMWVWYWSKLCSVDSCSCAAG